MPAMRLLIIVLVLLNVLALASTQGWLGTSAPRGEPERLSNQLNPEQIRLRAETHPAPAGQPVSAPEPGATTLGAAPPSAPAGAEDEACLALSGLADAATETLLQSLRAAHPELHAEHLTSATPSSWWVRIPPAGGREGAERKVAELRALGVEDLFIVQEAGPNQHAVSLGLFKTEAKAQQHLAFLQRKRVRGAAIATRSATVHRIEVRGAAPLLATIAQLPTVRQSGATTGSCEP